MKNKILMSILFFLLILGSKNVLAKGSVSLVTSSEQIQKNEAFNVSIKIEDLSASAFTTDIYFDSEKLEYISGPENSNLIENKIRYTWFDVEGGQSPRTGGEIATFTLKAKQEGTTALGIIGEFYNSKGNEIDVDFNGIGLKIGEINQDVSNQQENNVNKEENIEQEEINITEDNAYLKIMRLNEEGITPEFNRDVMEYYFITDNNTNSLNVTAIAENPEATVKIEGNTNLKKGLNEILIQVTSKDKTKKNIYKIHVTKTNNISEANSNLENLAIEYGELEAIFDKNITKYSAIVPSTVENLNILAVPEDTNASVSIQGNNELKLGNNNLTITVTAQNGYTKKVYSVSVYKRSKEEDQKREEEIKYQAEKASQIIQQEQNSVEQENKREEGKQENKNGLATTVIAILIIVILIITYAYIFLKFYKKKNKK